MNKQEKVVLQEIKDLLVGTLSSSELCTKYLEKQWALIQLKAGKPDTPQPSGTIIAFRQADYHTASESVSFEIPIKRKPKKQ